MGIADLFRPKYRHSNLAVRTEAVRALTAEDAAILAQVARTDSDLGVRRLAIERIAEPDVLAALAAAETERSLRAFAGERAAQLWQGIACDQDAEAAGTALTGIMNLDDQRVLASVAAHAALPAIRKRAFGELRDARALAELAKGDAAPDLRLAAVGRIDDGDVLRALAIDTTQKEVGLAAVDKLEDLDRLENVAHKAKNKAVRQRARKTLIDIADSERASKPALADDVKRRRAERSQLLREVEGVAETFDFVRHAATITKATEAWQALGGVDDEGYGEADARFAKCVDRFWKRKDNHEQQVRAADELRAAERLRAGETRVERDAGARDASDGGNAASMPASVRSATPATVAEAPRPEGSAAHASADTVAARNGAAARREQVQAERDARKQANAERAAAVVASLTAMCDDLETLAAKDKRTLERALQQAASAFEQISRVPSEVRDAIADRYAKARNVLVARLGELREAEDWARFQNVPKAEALIAAGKQMAAEQASPDLGNRLRALQGLWKEVGPMPQRRSKELWEQFKQVCDQIFENVKGYRAIEVEKFAEITAVKQALITSAEALVESTDWAATADKLKALQAQWKHSGHLPRKQGDELWRRFRAACDAFFERRKPMLEARRAEELENLAAKTALVTRAQTIASNASGDTGWSRAIAQIKDLQREWKDVGFVPRRDADAVYRAFRAACDEVFAKRDAARDAEANSHRADVEAIAAEIAAVASAAGADDGCVERALAVRAKVRDLDRGELMPSIDAMSRAVIGAHPDAVRGTELDPSALRARREKLIGKAEDLLPKQPGRGQTDKPESPQDIAAQLMQAMRSNAFADLRFSGRDPIEIVDDLRAQWAFTGPWLEGDEAQIERFEAACARVVEVFHRADEPRASDDGTGAGRHRRHRRGRHSEGRPAGTQRPPVGAGDPDAPRLAHDAPTAPAKQPFEPLQPPPVPEGVDAPVATRSRTDSMPPLPMDELDQGWDLSTEDPSAGEPSAADLSASEVAETSAPFASEMAGDGAPGGDGIDEPGWD